MTRRPPPRPRAARGLLAATALALGALGVLGALGTARPARAQAPAPAASRHEPATLATATGALYGTLELPPAGAGPWPALVVVSGSGPTDRDGNSPLLPGRNDSLRQLAEALAARGVATVRYDKRGIAASAAAAPAAGEAGLRFDQFVDDAAAWVRQLRADRRFAAVGLLGHSEGALIALLAAAPGGAARVVSVAGAGEPAARTIHRQLAAQLPAPLLADVDRVLAALEAGRTVDTLPAAVAAVPPLAQGLFRASVQPYMASWLRHDPAALAARLSVPLLVVQGTTDVQVDTADARRLAAANPRATLRLVPGMNHVLKLVPPDRDAQLRSYGDPALPVAPALVDAVAAFATRPAGAR